MSIPAVAVRSNPLAKALVEIGGGGSIIFRMQELVSRLAYLLSDLSKEASKRSQKKTKDHEISSIRAACLQKNNGNVSLGSSLAQISCLAMTALAKDFAPEVQSGMKFFAGEIGPQVIAGTTGWLSNFYAAGQSRETAKAGVLQTELGLLDKSSESQTFQSTLEQIMAAVRELLKRASS